MEPVVIVHGGAGPRRRDVTPEIDAQLLAALERAVLVALEELGHAPSRCAWQR